MPRATRAHLTEDVIVEASMRLIADSQSGDFTLSALAKKLGVSAPSLYSHVPGKQYIVERVRSRVVECIDCTSFASKPWDEALGDWARSYAEAFAQHPETIPLLATNPVQSPDLVGQYEIVAKALLAAGWRKRRIMAVITAVESLVLGSVLDLVAPVEMVDPDDSYKYPVLQEILDEVPLTQGRAMEAFELGLHALLSGLRERLAVD